ncbi:MAG: transcriptional repressor [Clostridia bacterium]
MMGERKTYQTKQQEAVSSLFAQRAEECLTPEEAYLSITQGGMDVGKTTVYRAIARLCEAGALRRYAPHESGESARYQYNPCLRSHLHIRCIYCGALEHLHCEEVEAFASHLYQHHGFTLDEGQTILYGCCNACAEARNQNDGI